jgi:hypothetical protein
MNVVVSFFLVQVVSSAPLEAVQMEPKTQKEQFNIAYIRAIAAQVGVNPGRQEVDDDSVDISFSGTGYSGKIRNPQIHIQLKCTSQDLVSNEVIKFPLKLKNYEDLRGSNVACPKYLAILLVPEESENWINHVHDGMLLRHRCYWVSLRDHPETANTTSVTVDIPLSQRLTPEVLQKMMTLASEGLSA